MLSKMLKKMLIQLTKSLFKIFQIYSKTTTKSSKMISMMSKMKLLKLRMMFQKSQFNRKVRSKK